MNSIARLRFHLRAALIALDALDRDRGHLDQAITDVLATAADDGLTSLAVVQLVRRRRATVNRTLLLLEQAGRIKRNARGRWEVVDG